MDAAAVPLAPRPRIAGLAAAAAGCLAFAALAWLALEPPPQPQPVAIDAPAWKARALGHVTALTVAPRPIATPANAQAREYILKELRAIGFKPEVQRTTVRKSTVHFMGAKRITIGVVNNIVVRIPGYARDLRRPALLLAARYDSGAESLDAARAAAPVAAMIETARQLRRDGPAANDIVLLFADGENVGMLGTQGFVEQHPLARRIGLALKFDSWGSGGPLLLYGTSGAGHAAMRGWRRAAPDVGGSSLVAELSQLLPGTPRVGPLEQIGAPVLLFANTRQRFDYNHANDTAERLEPATLVHMGDAMLRLAREYGAATLKRGRMEDQSWFSLPVVGLVHHSTALTWSVARVACVLLLGAGVLALRHSGVIPAVQGLFGAALVLLAVRMGTWSQRYELSAAGQAYDHTTVLQIAAVTVCAAIAALYALRKLAGTAGTVIGTLSWALAALVLLTALLPGAGYVLAWPLIAVLAAFALLESGWPAMRKRHARCLTLLAGLAPAAILVPPSLRDAWLAVAPHGLYLPVVLLAMPMLCIAALLLALRIGHVVAAGMALLLATAFTLPPHVPKLEAPGPAPNQLVYFKDMPTWRAYWFLPPQPLDAWTRQFFPDLKEPAKLVEAFGWNSPRRWFAVAPREDALFYPEIFQLKNSVGKLRYGEFTVRSKNRAPHIEMAISGTKPLRSRLNGKPLTTQEGVWWLSLYGMEDQLLHFEIEALAEDIFAVRVEEHLPGLPAYLLPPRPADAPPLLPGTGATVTTDILRFY